MEQLLGAFLEFGHRITFASTAKMTPHGLDLGSLGVKTVPILLNHPGFDVFVREENPDLVIFDRFMVEEQFGWRVAEQAPGALRLLNTEDLHSLRKAREEAYRRGRDFSPQQWREHPMALRELASLYRSDCSLIISSYEMELLIESGVPRSQLLYLPFMVAPLSRETVEKWPAYGERKDFICIGNGRHAPNVDSIAHLRRSIWPLIRRELPQVKLHIHGAYLPQRVLEIHDPKAGFLVAGWAADLALTFQAARLLLAPLHFGAGIKGKLLEAMYHGTPSITSPIGAEGMHGELPWNGAVIQDPAEFAKAAVELYRNQELWDRAQGKGVELIHAHYDKNRLLPTLKEGLATLENHLESHRSGNLIGRMLMDQVHASNKYMAKWIQAKNKLG